MSFTIPPLLSKWIVGSWTLGLLPAPWPLLARATKATGPWMCNALAIIPTRRNSNYLVQSGFKSFRWGSDCLYFIHNMSVLQLPAVKGELSPSQCPEGDPHTWADSPQSGRSLRCCIIMTKISIIIETIIPTSQGCWEHWIRSFISSTIIYWLI